MSHGWTISNHYQPPRTIMIIPMLSRSNIFPGPRIPQFRISFGSQQLIDGQPGHGATPRCWVLVATRLSNNLVADIRRNGWEPSTLSTSFISKIGIGTALQFSSLVGKTTQVGWKNGPCKQLGWSFAAHAVRSSRLCATLLGSGDLWCVGTSVGPMPGGHGVYPRIPGLRSWVILSLVMSLEPCWWILAPLEGSSLDELSATLAELLHVTIRIVGECWLVFPTDHWETLVSQASAIIQSSLWLTIMIQLGWLIVYHYHHHQNPWPSFD